MSRGYNKNLNERVTDLEKQVKELYEGKFVTEEDIEVVQNMATNIYKNAKDIAYYLLQGKHYTTLSSDFGTDLSSRIYCEFGRLGDNKNER